MSFNVEKLTVMHFGTRNNIWSMYYYNRWGEPLPVTNLEKDFGVIVTSDVKCTKQCFSASKKANMMLGFIARNF